LQQIFGRRLEQFLAGGAGQPRLKVPFGNYHRHVIVNLGNEGVRAPAPSAVSIA
jgi:hypothetical protein